ncbi:MAG: glutamate 5-kinase, partial [Bacteroidales bacterium]|nr:glutamate 5-kinase [Bacteroidales bacterium]
MNNRDYLKNKKRIIIKVGTALLTHENGKVNLMRVERLARELASLRETGKEIILVSSGAGGAGLGKLKLNEMPNGVIEKQALAAIGQASLLRMYETFFDEYDQAIGQVLLTRDGIENQVRRVNARNTINHLLQMDVIPIINENDTVSTAEIEFGDNDMLSVMVADLINADLLIILTNTNGVFTADPSIHQDARQVSTVSKTGSELQDIVVEGKSNFGSGGMHSKIQAAKLCQEKNIDVV